MSPLHSTKYLVRSSCYSGRRRIKTWKRACWLLPTTCHNYVRSGFQSSTCCPVVLMQQCGRKPLADGAIFFFFFFFCRKHAALPLRSGSTTCVNSTRQQSKATVWMDPMRSLLVHLFLVGVRRRQCRENDTGTQLLARQRRRRPVAVHA
jgi:hypothetical protein